jgi:hypothetical protein
MLLNVHRLHRPYNMVHTDSTCDRALPATHAFMVDGEEQWIVEQLLAVAGDEVQVKWAGWEDTTWEPIDLIRADCPGLLADLLLSDQICNDQCQQQKHLNNVASQLDLTAAELRRNAQELERMAFMARKRAVEADNIASRSRAITCKEFKLKALLHGDRRAKCARSSDSAL